MIWLVLAMAAVGFVALLCLGINPPDDPPYHN